MKHGVDADVIVAGLGPAGSTCARFLAHLGLSVMGIDRDTFPRQKACGGCVTDRALGLIGRETAASVERTYRGARLVYRNGDEVEISSDRPVAYGISRAVFDAALLDDAREAGAGIITGERCLKTRFHEDRVVVETDRGTYRASYLVGADGVTGPVAREVARTAGRTPWKPAQMVAYDVRIDCWPFDHTQDTIRIYFGAVPKGYGWAFAKDSYTSCGIVTRADPRVTPRALLDRFMEKEIGVGKAGGFRCRGGLIPLHLHGRARRLSHRRVLLVGDAAGLVDPFLAEGISYAVQSSALAAQVIASAHANGSADLKLYDDAVHALFYPSFDAAATLARAVYRFPRLAFLVMKKRHDIALMLFDLIRGERGYDNFVARFKNALGSFQ